MSQSVGELRVSDLGKKVVIASGVIAGIVLIASILDLVSGFPFAGQAFLDIVFIIVALIIGYMCYDTLAEGK
jgi:hypothetical protein